MSDWIRVRTDLYRDPKVIAIALELWEDDSPLSRYVNQNCQRHMTVTENVMRHVAAHACVTIWGTVRHRGKRVGNDLFLRDACLVYLDLIADLPGMGDAMAAVGWALETDDGVVFPRFFEDYNSEPVKQEPKSDAQRAREYRARKRSENARHDASQNRHAVTTEKRRVEKSREEESTSTGALETKGNSGLSKNGAPKENTIGFAGAKPRRVGKQLDRVVSADVDAVIEHYLTYHPRAKPGDVERKKIIDRLKEGYTVEDLKLAIDGCHVSPHHCGENDRNKKYQSLELIMRDSKHVADFLETAENPPQPFSKQTLRNKRWGDDFVNDDRIT